MREAIHPPLDDQSLQQGKRSDDFLDFFESAKAAGLNIAIRRAIATGEERRSIVRRRRVSAHAGDMAQPEGERDEADDGADSGPVDIGALHLLDELHQENPGQDDDQGNDDKSDHANPPYAFAPSINIGGELAVFRIPAPEAPARTHGQNRVLSLLAQQIC